MAENQKTKIVVLFRRVLAIEISEKNSPPPTPRANCFLAQTSRVENYHFLKLLQFQQNSVPGDEESEYVVCLSQFGLENALFQVFSMI